MKIGDFRADLLVENIVIVELKAAKTLESAHEAQLLNDLRVTDIEVGMLLNFGPKPEFKRLAFDNTKEAQTADHADGRGSGVVVSFAVARPSWP